MPLAGRAFLALWNDISPAREPEYNQWHTIEHVPERVAVAGFHGARRYVGRARDRHRYFTLYDVESIDVFDGTEYRDVVDRPTAWSTSIRPDFGNVVRAVCRVERSGGAGIGAAIACLCVAPEVEASALQAMIDEVLALPGVVASHVGRKHEDAKPSAFAAPAKVRAFDRIVLIEALDRDAARAALTHAKRSLRLDALPADFGADVYDLAFVFPGTDREEKRAHRRPEWDAR